MPTYCYECHTEEDGCGHKFEKNLPIEKSDTKATCPECHKKKCVYKDYSAHNVSFKDCQPTTLGALADRNSNRMSDEAKKSIVEKNRQPAFEGPLPEGASLYPRNADGSIITPSHQRKKPKE
jgi:predicted nucleic acid-binding Zn ribbon protein